MCAGTLRAVLAVTPPSIWWFSEDGQEIRVRLDWRFLWDLKIFFVNFRFQLRFHWDLAATYDSEAWWPQLLCSTPGVGTFSLPRVMGILIASFTAIHIIYLLHWPNI